MTRTHAGAGARAKTAGGDSTTASIVPAMASLDAGARTGTQADVRGRTDAADAADADDAETAPGAAAGASLLVASADESLLDVVDNLLNRGVVLHGDLILGLADVDLVYVRLSLLLCAADRVLPPR